MPALSAAIPLPSVKVSVLELTSVAGGTLPCLPALPTQTAMSQPDRLSCFPTLRVSGTPWRHLNSLGWVLAILSCSHLSLRCLQDSAGPAKAVHQDLHAGYLLPPSLV